MENPYKEIMEMKWTKYIIKHKWKHITFAFLFTLIFVIAGPIVTKDDITVKYSVFSASILLNFLASFLPPFLMYKSEKKNYHRWEKNFGERSNS